MRRIPRDAAARNDSAGIIGLAKPVASGGLDAGMCRQLSDGHDVDT